MKNNVLNYCSPLIQKLDNKLLGLEERKELVEELLEVVRMGDAEFTSDFWLDQFEYREKEGVETSYLKTSLNQDDMLYSDTYIAKILEIIGTYLLRTPELKEKEKECKDKIKVYHSKELFERSLKEQALINQIGEYAETQDVMNVLVKIKNYKKSKDLKISRKDIEHYQLLKDYDSFWRFLKGFNKELSDIKEPNNEVLMKKRAVRVQIASVKGDMELSYESIKRPIIFKQPLKDEGRPDWNYLDMQDEKQLLELLKIHKTDDLTNELNYIIMDLENMLKRVVLTDCQRNTLIMYRNGYSITEIAEVLNCTRQNVHIALKGIIKKLKKQYHNEYENWYYMNVSKGKYKKCKICNEVKLVSHFYKKGNSYSTICKECSKK